MTKSDAVFDSKDVSDVLGIGSIRLNKLIELESYGIRPSVKAGKGRGKRRLFSSDDVFGIALVWWLFEAGLRSGTIQFVLNQICKELDSRADTAAAGLLRQNALLLVVTRKPRCQGESQAKHPSQRVQVMKETILDLQSIADTGLSTLIIPVGKLFERLRATIQGLKSETEGD